MTATSSSSSLPSSPSSSGTSASALNPNINLLNVNQMPQISPIRATGNSSARPAVPDIITNPSSPPPDVIGRTPSSPDVIGKPLSSSLSPSEVRHSSTNPDAVTSPTASSVLDNIVSTVISGPSSSSSSPTSSLSPTSSAERRSLRRRDSKTTFFETLDQLLKLQGSRMDDQRVEFNPNLRKKSSSNPSAVQTRFLIASLLESDGPYPQVVLPKGNGYLLEGTSPDFVFGKDDIFVLERDQTSGIYRSQFWDRHHFDYYGNDEVFGDLVVSIKPNNNNQNIDLQIEGTIVSNGRSFCDHNNGSSVSSHNIRRRVRASSSFSDTRSPSSSISEYHVIVRTKTSTQYEIVPHPLPLPIISSPTSSNGGDSPSAETSSSSSSTPSPLHLLSAAFPVLSQVERLTPILTFEASKMLLDYDEHNRSATYKFGVILQKKRQVTEEEMFNNCIEEEEEEEREETTRVLDFAEDEEERKGVRINGLGGVAGRTFAAAAPSSFARSSGNRNSPTTIFNPYKIGGTGNSDGRALVRFMDLIADRVKLEGFEGFRGGLDVKLNHTGNESYYTQLRDGREIMFHVSTLLPFLSNDKQQLQRKRHIGNDMVCIVFQEENTPFSPDMIASHFLQVFIVVQPLNDGGDRYRVSVTRRADVPEFPPPLPPEGIFESDEEEAFGEWLLAKCINAEHACFGTRKLSEMQSRTRATLFEALINDLHEKNESILDSACFNSSPSESLSGKKNSKKDKESAAAAKKAAAAAEKSRKKSKVKTAKSLGGEENYADQQNQAERKTRSIGELLTPLTSNFISYSNPPTPQPRKKRSNESEDGGSISSNTNDAAAAADQGQSALFLQSSSVAQRRQERQSMSRVRRVPISTRTSGILSPKSPVNDDANRGADAVVVENGLLQSTTVSKEEISLEDEAVSIRSNNSEYSCSDDNTTLDLNDELLRHHHQPMGRGDTASPVQSAFSSNSASRQYLDFHLQRSKLQSLSSRKISYTSSYESNTGAADRSSVVDDVITDVIADGDRRTDHPDHQQPEIVKRLMAENAALKKQLEQMQSSSSNHFNSQAQHNFCILNDLSLKQTTV